MARRVPLILVVAVALWGAAASPAAAAVSVAVTGDQGLRIAVTGSITTELSVRPSSDGTKLDVTEQSAQMIPGNGCVQTDSANPQRLRCNRPSLNFVTFTGGSLRDRLFVLPGSGDCQCFGNAGDDELNSGDGADLVDGGAGNDVIRAGAGDDVLRGDDGIDSLTGGTGSDDEFGGTGDDLFLQGTADDGGDDLRGEAGDDDEVSYAARRGRVVVTNDNLANDGAPAAGFVVAAEGDNVHQDIEEISGGGGLDDLQGVLSAGGADGPALLELHGAAGDDTLRGSAGQDSLTGGAGVDKFSAGAGFDTLNARDAIDDQVTTPISCGDGFDQLDVDVRDDDTRSLPTGTCEQIFQGMVGELPNVHIRSARRSRGGRLKVRLRCPRKTRNDCRGRLRVGVVRGRRARARFGKRARYEIRRGRSKAVIAPVRGRRTPRRGTRVRVHSLERGQLGPRTSIRTLRLKG